MVKYRERKTGLEKISGSFSSYPEGFWTAASRHHAPAVVEVWVHVIIKPALLTAHRLPAKGADEPQAGKNELVGGEVVAGVSVYCGACL